jgi:hypothetical protein
VGTSSDAIYQIFGGLDTLDLQIVKSNESLLGKNIPTGDLNILGVLTQYCSSAPYTGGYQLLPRDSADITTITSVEDNEGKLVKYQLYQNYPNPFNPSTIISYYIPKEGNVVLKLYNILGQEIKTLVNERQSAGQYSIKFFASNISSGIYFYRLTSGNFSFSKKMILMK